MASFKIKSNSSLLLVFSLFFLGCNQEGKNTAETSDNPDNVAGTVAGNGTIASTQVAVENILEGDTMNFKQDTPPAFTTQLNKVVDAYLGMKDAFVKDNAAGVREQATAMANALNQIPEGQLSGEALTYWQEKKNFLIEHLALYQEVDNMPEKRENFIYLSTIMVKTVHAFGNTGQKLYVDYCPMANDNKGAYWLSQTEAIQNPYMGSKMPTCGEVKKEI